MVDFEVLEEAAERLRTSGRPILLVGHGVRCAGAVKQLLAFVRRYQIPVVSTQLAKDAIAYDDPLFVGHSGPKGDRAGNFAVQTADLILSVGSSLHAQTVGWEADLFAPLAFKIQVEIDYPVLRRGDVPVDLQIHADLTAFLDGMMALPSPPRPKSDWIQRCEHWKRRFSVSTEPHDVSSPELNYYEVAEALSNALNADEIIVTDAGSAFYVLGQGYRVKSGQRYIVSGAMGAMGYALPAAIGAAAASPGHMVICVTGDGSLQTNIQELQVLRHYGLNIKLFVVDNDGYVSIRNTQNSFFKGRLIGSSRESGVSMPPLDLVAEAYGLAYVAIEGREALQSGVERALNLEGPVVIGLRGRPVQAIIPTVTSRQVAGGAMRSNPLHIMDPPLPDDVLRAELGDFIAFDEPAPAEVS
jgi:acetolactate synthase-1/2/3 large subunit